MSHATPRREECQGPVEGGQSQMISLPSAPFLFHWQPGNERVPPCYQVKQKKAMKYGLLDGRVIQRLPPRLLISFVF